jgi:hypothetical protein
MSLLRLTGVAFFFNVLSNFGLAVQLLGKTTHLHTCLAKAAELARSESFELVVLSLAIGC